MQDAFKMHPRDPVTQVLLHGLNLVRQQEVQFKMHAWHRVDGLNLVRVHARCVQDACTGSSGPVHAFINVYIYNVCEALPVTSQHIPHLCYLFSLQPQSSLLYTILVSSFYVVLIYLCFASSLCNRIVCSIARQQLCLSRLLNSYHWMMPCRVQITLMLT